MLSPLSKELVKEHWPTIKPMFEKYHQGVGQSVSQMYDDLLSQKKYLLVDSDDEGFRFCVVIFSESDSLFVANSCSRPGLSFEDIDFQGYIKQIEQLAKILGLNSVTALVRPGLAQEYKGYKDMSRIMSKRV